MTALRVELFGHFSAVFDGVPLTALHTSRLQALLANLVLDPKLALSRDHLAYQLWPDSSESQARTNLRNLIHKLRQALPNFDRFVRSEAQSLQWRQEAPFALDVHEFELLLAPASGTNPDRQRLDRAVALYRGDLLPGCYDDWIVPERERLRLAYLSALEASATLAEEAREYAAALVLARRLALADPLRPAANHQLMRLAALLGDRSAALKSYRAYALLLERELGAAPEPEITDFYKQLIRAEAQPPAKVSPAQPSLVGRNAEWRRLQALWQTASAGDLQVVFVTGEAGIGKTRLVEEFGVWAQRQGVDTATASCYPAEGSLPYGPLVSWLRAHPLPPLDRTWLAEIGRVLPEIAEKHPGARPAREAWQRQHLFEALARALLAPWPARLLILEDCHWCDQDTLEWLHYALRSAPRAAVLIVATERTGETSPAHPLATLQTALRVEGRYAELHLKPLNEAETVQLAAQIDRGYAVQRLSPEAVAQVYRETEGNPLFVVELMRLGKELGPASQPGHMALADSQRIRAVLNRRLGKLQPATQEIAGLAATIGREFSLEVLREASGASDEHLVQSLDELLRSHIVREVSADRYDFTHDQLRQALVSSLSAAHRRLLHRKAAEALQCSREDVPCPQDSEVAHHFEQAGLSRLAIRHYRRAAESATQALSLGEALRCLQHAVSLAETLIRDAPDDQNPAELADLLVKLGDQLSLSGQFSEAQARYEQALAQTAPAPGPWRAQVYRKISDALIPQYRHADALAALDAAQSALPGPVDGATVMDRQEWIQVQLARCQVYFWSNQPEQQEAAIRDISPYVAKDGRLEQQCQLLSQHAQLRLRRERLRLSEETVGILQRRLVLAQALGDPLELAIAQFQFGFGLLWHGDAGAALDWLVQGCAGCARLGATIWQLRSLAYLAVARRKLGQLEALRGENQQLVELAAAIGEHDYHGIGLANLGWLSWQAGETATAEQHCLAARADWEHFGGNVFHGLADWVLLALAVEQGKVAQAANWAQALLDPDPTFQPIPEAMASSLRQGLSACHSRDEHTALACFQQAIAEAQAAREF